MPQYRILLAEFPGNQSTHPDVADWVHETLTKMYADQRIGKANVFQWRISDTPITMGRNRCLAVAQQNNIDYVLMVDSDMSPDEFIQNGKPRPGFEDAKPFWESSFEFMLAHNGPCVVGAPYCGPPPRENVFIFRWENQQGDDPNPNWSLQQFSRFEAAGLTGIKRAHALPTGVFLIDMRAIKSLKHPYFDYEWTDETHCYKASTEDVYFSRNLDFAGVPQYCNWDAWAGHYKLKCVSKPQFIRPADVMADITEGVKFYDQVRAQSAAVDSQVPESVRNRSTAMVGAEKE